MAAPQGRIISAAAVHNVDSVSCMAHHRLKTQFTVLILSKGHFCSGIGKHNVLCVHAYFQGFVLQMIIVLSFQWAVDEDLNLISSFFSDLSSNLNLQFHLWPSSQDSSGSLSPSDMSSPAGAMFWGVKAELSTSWNCSGGRVGGASAKPCLRPLKISQHCLEL